jgi:hypothetical protein
MQIPRPEERLRTWRLSVLDVLDVVALAKRPRGNLVMPALKINL